MHAFRILAIGDSVETRDPLPSGYTYRKTVFDFFFFPVDVATDAV